jgi:hypothetical protein
MKGPIGCAILHMLNLFSRFERITTTTDSHLADAWVSTVKRIDLYDPGQRPLQTERDWLFYETGPKSSGFLINRDVALFNLDILYRLDIPERVEVFGHALAITRATTHAPLAPDHRNFSQDMKPEDAVTGYMRGISFMYRRDFYPGTRFARLP